MTVWTKSQLREVAGLSVATLLDQSEVERARGRYREAVYRRLFAQLNEGAHTFACELCRDDIEFVEETRDATFQVKVTAAWRPSTKLVEIRGGYRDGQTLEFPRAPWDSLMIPTPPSPVALNDETRPYTTLRRLECVGWAEQERWWVYE